MNAQLISIGTELTTGQTLDTNTHWLAGRLAEIGIMVTAHHTIADELDPIAGAIADAARAADLVIINGGIGPTEDDLTRQALAVAMGVDLELKEEFVEHIRTLFKRFGRSMPDSNKIQAMFPAGSAPIPNAFGTAPGIHARLHDAEVFVTPGVPSEMREMFEADILPPLQEKTGQRVILKRIIWTYGSAEAAVNDKIRDLMKRGNNPSVGTTAQDTIIGIRLVARGDTPDHARRLLDETTAEIGTRLGTLIFGRDGDTLATAVAALLIEKKKTVATAESCTGGLIAKHLTDVAGSSAYFLDGLVTYSNEAKTRLLDVPAELIDSHGAVSAPVADAMAANARRISQSDYAIAVTGIAGPGGGTDEKPVGLVYLALAAEGGVKVREFKLPPFWTRDEIRDRTTKIALNLLRLKLIDD
jgi:nicotinamide-nucleotide amidase